jgi:hypothetical protein
MPRTGVPARGRPSNKRFQRTPVLARLTWRRELAPLKRNMLD